MTESPEIRLKRLRMRSWRRGTKEMDLILGRFADMGLAALSPEWLDSYEDMLGENDHDLYLWFSGRISFPEEYQQLGHHIMETSGIS